MRKLFALLTVVFFAGFMMAQNTSIVNETGNGNTHAVDQTGSNTSTINQEALPGASNNHAFVTQNGVGNEAIQNQHQQAGITAPQNVTIFQFGNDNLATQDQGFGYTGYNDATITQLSNDNTGYQKQDGYNMTAVMTQSVGDLNNGSQFQYGSHQSANMTQTGASNLATQNQQGINHVASITSTGDGNTAFQTQAGGTYNSPPTYLGGHDATINQSGNGNFAAQNQAGLENNSASITQQGSSNQSLQNQNGSSNNAQTVIAGGSNYTQQIQTGDGNFSYFASSYNTHSNVMSGIQSGYDNYDNSRIQGNGTDASDFNTITETQTGTGNKAYNWVIGNHNSIITSQTGDGNISGTGNVFGSFGVYQEGDFNSASVTQAGVGFNHSQVTQIGDHNTGTVDQH